MQIQHFLQQNYSSPPAPPNQYPIYSLTRQTNKKAQGQSEINPIGAKELSFRISCYPVFVSSY